MPISPAPRASQRIKAIITAPEAKEFPTLSRMLALETGLDEAEAIGLLRAAAHDRRTSPGVAFAAVMSSHFAGPYLGSGGDGDEPRSYRAGLTAARDYQERRSRSH